MPKIDIYTTQTCPFCFAAKALLEDKGVQFTEIDVSMPDDRQIMIQRANGRRTVPQIFVGDTHVGGYDDIAALERSGRLEPLLGEAAKG